MALTIPDYLQPGAYSSIVPNPTATTASGPPVVAILGNALRGSYEPVLFTNLDDAQAMYGQAYKGNPLPLAIQFAFQNGAPQVLGLNVQPDNSTPSYFDIPISGLPTNVYGGAPKTAVDAVTGQLINQIGNVAGTFYVQDYNPTVPDPLYGTDPNAVALAYAQAGNTSMLQYESAILNNAFVPLQNSPLTQVTVYEVYTTTPSSSAITQANWNQLQNAFALAEAFNSSYLSSVAAEVAIYINNYAVGSNTLTPNFTVNTGGTAFSDAIAVSDLKAIVSQATAAGSTPVTITTNAGVSSVPNLAQVDYIASISGFVRVSAINNGPQHQIIVGLFDSFSASIHSHQALGLPVSFPALQPTNPYIVTSNGDTGVVTTNSYINALSQLTNLRADVVVGLNTSPSFQQALETHVTTMSNYFNKNERIGIVSGAVSDSEATAINNVSAIQGYNSPVAVGAKRMVYVWPSAVFYYDNVLNTTIALNGTYIGAALAGILTSHDSATPLTHKVLTGFTDVAYHLSNPDYNNLAQYGICIIENNPTFGLRVRDGITCDPSTPDTQEISVVRQLDYAAQSLRDVMDANIIATKITRNTLAVVTTLATNTLQALEDSNLIYGYQNVAARINPNDPREIDLSCLIRPAYPCKYVKITISVTSSLQGF